MTLTTRSGTIFRFGDLGRIKPYLDDAEQVPALRLRDLWRLRAEDVIVSCRPRSSLFEALILLRRPDRRPGLVTVSDGFIFRQNAHKRSNRRYGWLNKHVLADRLVVRQPIESLDGICAEPEVVTSLTSYGLQSVQTRISAPVFVCVAGNDPYLDLPAERCAQAFTQAIRDVQARFPAARVLLSCPNARLRGAIMGAVENLDEIGRIAQADLPLDRCVFFGSPSTVLHDQFLAGRPCYILAPYAQSGFEAFCAPFDHLIREACGAEITSFEHLGPKGAQILPPLGAEDLRAMVAHRHRPQIAPRCFFTAFQPMVCANELRLLLTTTRGSKK